MEDHSHLSIPRKDLLTFSTIQALYAFAQEHVKTHRQAEFDACWNRVQHASNQSVSDLGPHFFWLEYTWCVYVSGFKASTVSKKFKPLLVAHQIETLEGNYIETPPAPDFHRIYKVWSNKAKAKAVQTTRGLYKMLTWPVFCQTYLQDRLPEKLQELPYMGPALSCHLARNLGNVNTVKPDVHLCRLAAKYGFETVLEMCKAVSKDFPGKVDLVFWFASIDNSTRP